MSLFGQKKFEYKNYHFSAKYVLKNSKDTIFTKIENFDKNRYPIFSYSTIVKRLHFRNSNGEKEAINEGDIQYLEINDNLNVNREFIASSSVLNKNKGLLEVFHTGKISFFSDYNYNYDLSINSFARDIIVVRDYLVDNQNGKFYGPYAHKLGAFSAITLMDNLKENFKDYPDLQSMTENVQSKESFINLLKSYDAK
ncbi:hypothetical protein SAMN05444371_3135 [Epilithonimonas mollis]|uniref:Uncharacterized protein n=2 Tax=Epilithonimonas mollis TaxID=216903 RepID=A0A1M6U534_9FLAO|nr:hypothetical protein SAMN05444371_3135 [Epilithonimonas mollis]